MFPFEKAKFFVRSTQAIIRHGFVVNNGDFDCANSSKASLEDGHGTVSKRYNRHTRLVRKRTFSIAEDVFYSDNILRVKVLGS